MTPSQSYYDYVRDGLAYHPENGWELMLLNLGKYPNGEVLEQNVSPLNSIPYIVLYNKYSGVLRAFVNFGPDQSALDGAKTFEVTLSIDEQVNYNGILRLAEGKDRTLDQTTNIKKFKTIVPAPLDASQWAVADFQLMYDPCVCFYPSGLNITIREILSSEITLHGREITLNDQPLITDELTVNPLADDFLAGFDYTGETAEGGVRMYRMLEGFVDAYITDLENYLLDAAGKIRACEVKVSNPGWCDYVFAPDYKLMTLWEIEQFIIANRHLPEVPSEAEVEEDGINLAEMNAILLKKIEEMTLHMIAIEKRLLELETK